MVRYQYCFMCQIADPKPPRGYCALSELFPCAKLPTLRWNCALSILTSILISCAKWPTLKFLGIVRYQNSSHEPNGHPKVHWYCALSNTDVICQMADSKLRWYCLLPINY